MKTIDISQAHIDELKRQNTALLSQVKDLTALVHEIPGIIVRARLDAKEGAQTKYNYARAYKACAIRC